MQAVYVVVNQLYVDIFFIFHFILFLFYSLFLKCDAAPYETWVSATPCELEVRWRTHTKKTYAIDHEKMAVRFSSSTVRVIFLKQMYSHRILLPTHQYSWISSWWSPHTGIPSVNMYVSNAEKSVMSASDSRIHSHILSEWWNILQEIYFNMNYVFKNTISFLQLDNRFCIISWYYICLIFKR